MKRRILILVVALVGPGRNAEASEVHAIDAVTKDWLDAGSKFFGALGILIAGVGLYRSARTRGEDLRWRQATAAHDALSEIHKHPEASKAIDIMDCHLAGHAIRIRVADNSKEAVLTLDAVCSALATPGEGNDVDHELYRCFDWLFYFVDRSGFMVRNHFVQFGDIAGPLAPYAKLLRDRWDSFSSLASVHNYSDADVLLRRITSESRALQ
jgi:hypothetical protein